MVVDEYDTARPSYPDELFDALGPLDGCDVFDVGAGTGIATRALLARHANVIAVDPGPKVLARARSRTPGLVVVVADGAVLPVRSHVVDLLCFAQSWHWLDEATRVQEVHRVLRAGGRWAGWWSHPRADELGWFEQYWTAIEQACPGTNRDQRDIDWGATIAAPDRFEVAERITVPWVRDVSVDNWMTDQASHSYIVALPDQAQARLLDELGAILTDEFPDGTMTVPYETWLWVATRL